MRKFTCAIAVLVMLTIHNVHANKYACHENAFSIVDTLEITLLSIDHCNYAEGFAGHGFIIYATNYLTFKSEVLWGLNEMEQCKTKYSLVDIDNDNVDEILTFYQDESNIWGYVHRFRIDGAYSVSLQSLRLPATRHRDEPLEELLRINPDHSITILGRTFETHNNISIYYDSENDSLGVRETTPD